MNRPEGLVIYSGVIGCGITKGFAAAGTPTAVLSRNATKISDIDNGVGP